jgi:AcrR family transcriptional regulator
MARAAGPASRDDQDSRRAQILDEAIRIVGERGYYGFTVQELAQRCGVSNAGLLYHFSTKDILLLAMLEEFERRERAAIAPLAALAKQAPSPAALADLLRTMVARSATQPELGRLCMVLASESLDPSHPAHAAFRAREAAVLALFTRLVSPYVTEPRSTARQLFALLDGLGQQWVREDQAFDIQAEWDRAMASLIPALDLPRRTPS